MQEMIELSRQQLEQPENPPRAVTFQPAPGEATERLQAGPAQFGPSLGDIQPVSGVCGMWGCGLAMFLGGWS